MSLLQDFGVALLAVLVLAGLIAVAAWVVGRGD